MGWGRRLLTGLAGALLLVGPALAAPQNQTARPRAPLTVRQQGEPRPAIWVLRDADTTI